MLATTATVLAAGSPDLTAIDSWPAAVVALVVLILQVPGLVSTVRTRRDTRAIRAQTENDHADAEHPNLREQLDAMHADIRQAAARAEEAAKVASDTQTALTDHVASDEAWKTSVEVDIARRRRPLLSWRY